MCHTAGHCIQAGAHGARQGDTGTQYRQHIQPCGKKQACVVDFVARPNVRYLEGFQMGLAVCCVHIEKYI